MKTKQIYVMLLLLLLGFTSCKVVSIHPLWTKDTRIFKKELLGDWNDDKEETTFRFESLSDTAYKVSIIFSGEASYQPGLDEQIDFGFLTGKNSYPIPVDRFTFEGNLIKLGEFYFLDLFPFSGNTGEDFGFIANELNYMPVHTFMKVELSKEKISLWTLDHDRLETLFEKNRIRLAHESEGDFTVITASSKELQQFMKKYANDKKAFDEAGSYTR